MSSCHWSFVEGLDVSALLGPIKSLEGRPGHPAADPRILLGLWLFGTLEGVASARQVASLCGEHITGWYRQSSGCTTGSGCHRGCRAFLC